MGCGFPALDRSMFVVGHVWVFDISLSISKHLVRIKTPKEDDSVFHPVYR